MTMQETKRSKLGADIPLIYHFAMLQDDQRMNNFRDAIDATVPVGGKVLELGGGTGVLSFYAAQKASKVYCVEQIPENVKAARKFLSSNPNGDRVEVIQANAFEYLPPEPVDVVICEMIHVGMLREKQIEMMQSFKRRYTERFGEKLPQFIPEAFIQGVQPMEYDFNFFGYNAPVPLFQIPGDTRRKAKELSDPVVFQTEEYRNPLASTLSWDGSFKITEDGTLNSVRMVMKNVLTIIPAENRAVFWHNHYLILPLENPIDVKAGEEISISLSYTMGCEIEEFLENLKVEKKYVPNHFSQPEQTLAGYLNR